MKKLLLLISFFIVLLNLVAQKIEEPIRVTGQFKSGYPTISASREIKNILFLQEHGQYPKAERGYWFLLDEQSAEVLGTKQILVIPLNESREESFWYNGADKSMEVHPMLGNAKVIYYTKDDSLISSEKMSKIQARRQYLETIQPGNTVDAPKFTEEDYRFRPMFVDWLTNDGSVVVKRKKYFYNGEESGEIAYVETKISELATAALIQSYHFDSYYDDFDPKGGDYLSKERFDKWIDGLPQPEFKKPDMKISYKKTPWSSMRWATYQNESFLQREDNNFIYALTPEANYIFNTQIDTLAKSEKNSFRCDTITFKTQEKFVDSTVNEWLEDQGWLDSKRYIKLSSGDILLALVCSNGFEEQLYVYKIEKDTYNFSKALHIDSMVPLESSSASGMKVMKLFEAYGKYYLIINFGNTNYWAVLTDEMFLPS